MCWSSLDLQHIFDSSRLSTVSLKVEVYFFSLAINYGNNHSTACWLRVHGNVHATVIDIIIYSISVYASMPPYLQLMPGSILYMLANTLSRREKPLKQQDGWRQYSESSFQVDFYNSWDAGDYSWRSLGMNREQTNKLNYRYCCMHY